MRSLLSNKRRLTIVILALVALLIVGGGYVAYDRYTKAAAATEEPATQTATVTRGDIVITASGTGELQPDTEVALGFRISGTLIKLPVEVGDRVKQGQVLARLDDTTARIQVAQSKIALERAEIQLTKLTSPTEAELTKAKENLLAAQLELDTLKKGGTDEEKTIAWANLEKARIDLQDAQSDYDKVAWKPDVASSPQAQALEKATTEYKKAQAAYTQATTATDEELTSARARVAQAQVELDDLVSPAAEDLRTGELDVEKARNDLKLDEITLSYTVLTAPLTGTVVAVNAEVGERVSTNPIITLANVETLQLCLWVEEEDRTSVAAGHPIEIVFDVLPDHTFKGQIFRVDPQLVTVDGSAAVQSWATVDLSSQPVNLPIGAAADVEIIAGEARNVLLVPVRALRETSPGQYAVFVVQSDGQLELRPVEVGLKDAVNAEIISGLREGEVVSTGAATKSTAPNGAPGGGPGMGPGSMFGGG